MPIYCAPLLRPSAASICCVPLRRPSDASEFGPLHSDGDTTTTATHWWVTSNDVGAEHLSNMGGGADTAASLCCNERNSIGRTTATHWWVTSNDVALQMMLLPNICQTWKVGQIHGVSLLQPAEQYSTKQRVFNGVWTTQRSMAQQRSSPAQRTALPWATASARRDARRGGALVHGACSVRRRLAFIVAALPWAWRAFLRPGMASLVPAQRVRRRPALLQ